MSSPFYRSLGAGITEFVERNRSLVSCWLEDFVLGATNEDVARFARVVGASSVRILHLKRMNPAGVCAFLDAIPASHIHTLCVSIEEMSAEKEKAVLASVVQFITDPMRSRSVKYLDISFLSNEAKSVIKHVILGSREALDANAPGVDAQQPNLSILQDGLGWPTGGSNTVIVFPEWMTHSRYLDISAYGNMCQRVYERNSSICECTRQEAFVLLGAARVIGCRARFLEGGPDVFPFAKLPGGLRIRILAALAPHLDRTQIISVLSWACCAATIGHCCRPRADTRPPMAPILDVPAWNWDECATSFAHGCLTFAEQFVDSHDPRRSRLCVGLPFLEATGTNAPSWACYASP